MLLWDHTQLVVEMVVLVLSGILQGEDTPLGLVLIFDEGVFLSYANHHTLVTRMTHNGWEDKNFKPNWETKYITTMQEEL